MPLALHSCRMRLVGCIPHGTPPIQPLHHLVGILLQRTRMGGSTVQAGVERQQAQQRQRLQAKRPLQAAPVRAQPRAQAAVEAIV